MSVAVAPSRGLPDELLVQILEDESSDRELLAALCLVSHRVRRIVLPWLYNDVSRFKSINSVLAFFGVLSSRPNVCLLVRDLDLTHYLPVVHQNDASIRAGLQLMTNLKRLVLPSGYPTSILQGCSFQLDGLSCAFDCDVVLEDFFRSQLSLTELRIYGFPKAFWTVCSCGKDARILPRLEVVRATASWLEMLVPLRPVHTVQVLDLARWASGFLVSRAGPVRALTLPRPCMLANWGMLSQTPGGDITDLVVTDMATGASSSLLNVLSNARVLKPESLTLSFRAEAAWDDRATAEMLYFTIQMFLNTSPPALQRLHLAQETDGARTVNSWHRHPLLDVWVQSKN